MKTLDEMIAVMQAARDGKCIDRRSVNSGDWHPATAPSWDWMVWDYRIRPERKRVPLGNQDIDQQRDLFRRIEQPDVIGIATAINVTALYTLGYWFSFEEAMTQLEISYDGGKPWQPCWKEEA